MEPIPEDYGGPVRMDYDGRVAVFPSLKEAEQAFAAAKNSEVGGYRHVTLTVVPDAAITHASFADWF